MAYTVKKQIRQGLPQVGVKPYRQVHAHSTGNANSTAQNEADYHDRRPVESGFFQYVVGNGIAIQTAPLNMGAYDVGGGWNVETFAAVELIESHKTRAEFERDYAIYCELLRDLANQGGIPVTLDTSDLAGIKTHNYCTHNQPNNFSDHVDPIPYLVKWGISQAQFAKDLATKVAGGTTTTNTAAATTVTAAKTSGKTVTIAKTATHWSPSSKGKAISSTVKGKSFTVKQERAINYSRSKKEYLLYSGNTAIGWLLEQDAVGFTSAASNNTGQKVNQGIYQVDELKQVNGIWQVRCNFLVPVEFNWTDNGIACADIVLVDKNGYVLKDQTTQKGSLFVFDTNCIKGVGSPVKGSGGYTWCKVNLKTSGNIWLSVVNKEDLIKKISNS